jgi:hypothetical protein
MPAKGEPFDHMTPDRETRAHNEAAGHTLCEHCNGTGNELCSMYRACPECSGGIAVKYGELTALGRWWAERREQWERKRRAREYAPPRDWKLEISWRLSRWFGIGHTFHGSEECHRCHAPACDIDYDLRRVAPFRAICRDHQMCDEGLKEMEAANAS